MVAKTTQIGRRKTTRNDARFRLGPMSVDFVKISNDYSGPAGTRTGRHVVSEVVDRSENDGEGATQDDETRPHVSASPVIDPVEAALAHAITRAAEEGRFDVIVRLARELEARRVAHR
jgi:hypothetical protein